MSQQTPTRRRRPQKTQRSGVAALFTVMVALLSGAAFFPIYQHPRIWLVAAVGALLPLGVLVLGHRRMSGVFTLLTLVGAFALLVLPVAAPGATRNGIKGLAQAEALALAEVVRGWKHILTLTLPLGTYQNVMVPALAATVVANGAGVALILRGGRSRALAALPALIPVLVATFLGAATVSEPLRVGPLTLLAPRETALWVLTIAIVGIWLNIFSGSERRAALRRGRAGDEQHGAAIHRGALVRGVAAGVTLTLAVLAGLLIAPVIDADTRLVPRDRVDPEIVAREQVSPLAGYRRWKQDDTYYSPLFTVSGTSLPPALRLVVLDHFDGVDFSIGPSSQIGRFVRLPSARPTGATSLIRIRIESGYDDIWVPMAELGSPPEFFGERTADLTDAFYVNRELGVGLAVPTGEGLRAGDSFEALMSIEPTPRLTAGPLEGAPLMDLSQYPQLEQWVELQDLPPGARGLEEAIERLRERGYLSHAIAQDEADPPTWLQALGERTPVTFIPSAGGHGTSRIEELFEELIEQQQLAPADAETAELVAGIGDDEQFATAAALLARALGYDSRVVVGVRLGQEETGDTPIPVCTSRCEGRHLTAWIEVRGDDDEWVPMTATPQVAIPPTLTQRGEQFPEHSTHVQERDAVEADPPAGETDTESGDDPDPEEPDEPIDTRLRRVLLILAAVILVALPWAFVPAAKRVRTWRRRRLTPAELAVIGAWNELTDMYLDTGHRVPENSSRSDVAEDLGWHRDRAIAEHVDRAVFSPEGVDEEAAEEFWRIITAQMKDHRDRLGAWARLRALLSLRSLGGRRDRRRDRGR